MTNPEISLIQKLSEVRQALEGERQELLARVAVIEQALAVAAPTKVTKPHTKEPKGQRAGGIREAVLTSLVGKTGTTIRQLQDMLPDHSPKSVESVTHGLASAGLLKKEGTNPKRFSLVATAAE
jgi:hypothetical protein